MLVSFVSLALAASVALAAPNADPSKRSFQFAGCNPSKATLALPAGQTALAVPAGQKPAFVAIGVGIQNYTCTATNTWGSIGAVATLFDASCAATQPKVLNALPAVLLEALKCAKGVVTALSKSYFELGQHYFITNPVTGTGITPRFDFTASQKNSSMFFDGTKTGDIASPAGATNDVDWLELGKLLGGLATTVFRVQTDAGVPPTTCSVGQATSIPYAAEYWFFN